MANFKYTIIKDGQEFSYSTIREARVHIKRDPGAWVIRKDKYENDKIIPTKQVTR